MAPLVDNITIYLSTPIPYIKIKKLGLLTNVKCPCPQIVNDYLCQQRIHRTNDNVHCYLTNITNLYLERSIQSECVGV